MRSQSLGKGWEKLWDEEKEVQEIDCRRKQERSMWKR